LAQKDCQPAEQEAEVVAGGGEHGVDGVALAVGEVDTSKNGDFAGWGA